MKTVDELWKDLKGFTPPNCPECGHTACLDELGYWCDHCSEATNPKPAVDDIPNGYEFQEILTAYQKAAGIIKPQSLKD